MHSNHLSIILPTYNSIQFIKERLASILDQTLSDWECIVIDGFSKDGTWEFLKETQKIDKRFSLFRSPPRGPYDAWNQGIQKAKGEYIYIATSDDTMAPDCLKKLVEGLDNHPDCDIAHCNLEIIDKDGKPVIGENSWDRYLVNQYFGEYTKIRHIRPRGHDFLLYPFVGTVYTSITQLLIRRSLFQKTGMFSTTHGSFADYGWGMKAALFTNTLHIPESLATWRIHSGQLTSYNSRDTPRHQKILIAFINENFKLAKRSAHENITLPSKYLFKFIARRDQFFIEYYKRKNVHWYEKLIFFGKWLALRPEIVFYYLTNSPNLKEAPLDYLFRIIGDNKFREKKLIKV